VDIMSSQMHKNNTQT